MKRKSGGKMISNSPFPSQIVVQILFLNHQIGTTHKKLGFPSPSPGMATSFPLLLIYSAPVLECKPFFFLLHLLHSDGKLYIFIFIFLPCDLYYSSSFHTLYILIIYYKPENESEEKYETLIKKWNRRVSDFCLCVLENFGFAGNRVPGGFPSLFR